MIAGSMGSKKITGRKRHILVDILGLVIVVLVSVASAGRRHDRPGQVLDASRPNIKPVWRRFGATGSTTIVTSEELSSYQVSQSVWRLI